MKKLLIAVSILSASFVFAGEHGEHHGKSCDMDKKDGAAVSATGKVTCKGDDCKFQTADAKSTWSVCEMSKVDVAKLGASDKSVAVKGKLIKCEGEEKLVIESAQ